MESAIIERLREERRRCEQEDVDNGFEHGYEGAKYLQYADLVKLVRFIEADSEEVLLHDEATDRWLRDLIFSGDEEYVSEEAYRRGWCDGAMKFWSENEAEIMKN